MSVRTILDHMITGTVVITIVEVGGVTTIVEVGVMTIVAVEVMITVAVDVTMTATVTGTTGGMMTGGRGDFSFLFWWLRELNRNPGSTGTMTETVTGITIGVMTAGTDVLDVLQNALCYISKSKTSASLHSFSLLPFVSTASPCHYVFYFSTSSLLSNYLSEGCL